MAQNFLSDIALKTGTDSGVSHGLRIIRSANSDTGYINYQGGAFRFVATDGDPIKLGHVSNDNRLEINGDGNVTFAGDITVEGGDATIKKAAFPGGVLTLGREYSSSGDMTSALIQFQARNSSSTLRTFGKIEGRSNGYDGGSIYFYTENSGTETQALLIDENQNATFAGNIRLTTDIGRDDHNRIMFSTDDSIIYRVADTHRFRMDSDNFSPYADSSYDLGTSSLYFRAAYIDAITTTGNVTVGGDLTVNGTTTTVNQTNLDVSDNIIGLNRGAGSNANDSGIIIERGSTGDNAAFLWDESIGYFSFGTTQETASSTGAIANESDWTWKPIKASGAVYTGGIYIGGTTEMTGYAYVAERIVHTGDTDTYLRFVDNNPHFFAGGVNVLDLQASETQFTGDLFTFTSANSTDPLVNIKNTTNDANGARLRFTKDKGAAGADDDVVGQIEFVGDNAAQELTEFAKIQGSIETAADGTEGGRLRLGVASHDGEMRYGLVLHDGDAEDEIDVSIGGGAASVTTVAGDLSIYNKLTFRYNDNHYIQSGTNNWAFKANSGSVALSLTTGGAAEFAGNVSAVNLNLSSATGPIITLTDTDSTIGVDSIIGHIAFVGTEIGGETSRIASVSETAGGEAGLRFYTGSSVTQALQLDKDQNATFAGYVQAYANSDTVPGLRIQSNDTHGWEFLHRATEGDLAINREVNGTTTQVLKLSRSTSAATFAGDVSLLDSKTLNIGTGNDLQIIHDGTNSIITNTTGSLYIRNDADDNDIYFQCDDGSNGRTNYFYLDGSTTKIEVVKEINSASGATFAGDILAEGGDITVKNTGAGNAYLRAYATGTGAAGLYIDAVNGDAAGSDYFSLRQLDNKAIEFNARTGTGVTTFYSKGSLNLTQDGANSTFAGPIAVNATSYDAGNSNGNGADEFLAEFKGGTNNVFNQRYLKLTQTFTGSAKPSPLIVFEANHDSDNHKSYVTLGSTSDGEFYIRQGEDKAAVAAGSDLAAQTSETFRITPTGTATFAGSVNIDANQKLYLGGSTARMHVYHTGSGGTANVLTKEGDLNLVNQSHGDDIVFKTENDSGTVVTPLTLDSDGGATFAGAVGIGSTASSFHADADDLVVGGGSGNTGITIHSGTGGYGSIFFADGTADDATEKRGQIRYLQGTETMDFHTDNVATPALTLGATQVPTFTNPTVSGTAMYIYNTTNQDTDTKTLIDFRAHASDDSTFYVAGQIGSKAEGTWTSTSGTRDASLIFNTVLNGNNELALTLDSNKLATFAGTLDVNGASASTFYALQLSRSGSGTADPDIWGENNTFVIGTSSSTEVISLSNSNATFAGDVTMNGNVQITNSSGDTLTLTKGTTEPSFRIEGDTDKDFVITVSGELLTFTQNDGATDILTLDHDTKAATFAGTLTTGATTITSATNLLLTLNPTAGDYGGILFQYGGATKGLSYYNSGLMIFGGESGISTRLQAGGAYGLHIDATNRNVHIGGTSDATRKLEVSGTFYASSSSTFGAETKAYSTIGGGDNVRTGIAHYDNTAQAANIGGQLVLGYKYTDAGAYTEGAIIKMYKENGTTGQYGSGLNFQVRSHGEDLSTKMILKPNGQLRTDGDIVTESQSGIYIKSNVTEYHQIFHSTSTNDLVISSAGDDVDFISWLRMRNGNGGTILGEWNNTTGHLGVGGQSNGTYELYVHGAAYINSSIAVNGDANITGHVTGKSLTAHNNRGQNHGGGTDQEFPIGHWNEGEEVFSIDPTWTNDQLQNYFGSSNVEWLEDSTAPSGWAIKITGGVNVGGAYDSGFPYIAIEEDAIYYMECHIRGLDSDTSVNHYMGSIDYKEDFNAPASGAGNPGSYGYWVMSSANTSGQTWAKATGIIRGFHNTTTGMFETGAKYWTPQALFNYSHGAGTRACVISGWKVVKISGKRMLADGAAGTPSLTFAEDQDTGIFRNSANSFSLTTGGTQALSIDSSQNAAVAGNLTVSGGSIFINDANTELKEGGGNAVRIDTNSGYLDIGPMNSSWCHLQTDRSRFYFNTEITVDTGIINSYAQNLILRRAYDSTYQMTLSTTAATFTHDVVAFSDKKLKENIKTLDGSKVYNMRGVSFTRKDNGEDGSGVIAQEIQKVAPELVNETDGTLGVSYGNITGYLIEAIKDLKAEIEELKKCNKCNDCNCK